MKILFVYFISVIINPVVIMAGSTLLFPDAFRHSITGILFQTALTGFSSVWFGTVIFSFFGLKPVPLIVFLIGVVFFINYLIVYDFKDNTPVLYNATLLGAVGSLSGIMTAGACLF